MDELAVLYVTSQGAPNRLSQSYLVKRQTIATGRQTQSKRSAGRADQPAGVSTSMSPDSKKFQQDLFLPFETSSKQAKPSQEPSSKRSSAPAERRFQPDPDAAAPLRPTNLDERYLSDREVADRYGVSRATIWRWRNADPLFPQPIVVSPGTTRWVLSDLLDREARMPTAPRGHVRGTK